MEKFQSLITLNVGSQHAFVFFYRGYLWNNFYDYYYDFCCFPKWYALTFWILEYGVYKCVVFRFSTFVDLQMVEFLICEKLKTCVAFDWQQDNFNVICGGYMFLTFTIKKLYLWYLVFSWSTLLLLLKDKFCLWKI